VLTATERAGRQGGVREGRQQGLHDQGLPGCKPPLSGGADWQPDEYATLKPEFAPGVLDAITAGLRSRRSNLTPNPLSCLAQSSIAGQERGRGGHSLRAHLLALPPPHASASLRSSSGDGEPGEAEYNVFANFAQFGRRGLCLWSRWFPRVLFRRSSRSFDRPHWANRAFREQVMTSGQAFRW